VQAADGEVVMRLAPDFRPMAPYRLELRSGSPDAQPIAQGKLRAPDEQPELRLAWSRMGKLLSTGATLFLVAVDAANAPRDAQAVPAHVFRTGLALVRRVTRESAGKAARFTQACEPHREIIVT
jgi:hypothetical protein